jgi:tetratricopeptide (TPR) repeat protein
MLDCELFGLDAGAHHVVNVVVHALNASLLFLLWSRLTAAFWRSAFVAALFAWHPLHVESVAWVAERKDVLSTFFALLTLWVYAKYVTRDKWQVAGKESAVVSPVTCHLSRYYWMALLFFALGLMAKPMLVTLPFVMLLLDYWPLRRVPGAKGQVSGAAQFATLLLEKLPFFLLSSISCIVTVLAQRAEAIVALDRLPPGLRLENAIVSYALYLLKTIWPVNLAVVYPLARHLPWIQVAAATVVVGIISFLVWRARGPKPHLFVGWFWFLGTLVPVIGLVQVGGQAMADRYTYIPLIGVFIAVAFECAHWLKRFRVPAWVTVFGSSAILLACSIATARQLRYWRDSETLFAHAVAATKPNAIARINLGIALEERGRRAEALEQYREALNIEPNRAQAHNNLANVLDELGQTNEALAEYRAALRLNPNAPLAHLNLGTLLVKLGQFDEAMGHYAEAARLTPDDPRPHYLTGKACLRRGASAGAVAHFREALRRDANDAQTLTLLARVLASDNNPQVRNGMEAVGLAERANLLTSGEVPVVLDVLAMAYAETGRFDDAQQAVRKAIQIASAAGEKDSFAGMQQRLQLYQSGQPYRDSFTNAPGISP